MRYSFHCGTHQSCVGASRRCFGTSGNLRRGRIGNVRARMKRWRYPSGLRPIPPPRLGCASEAL
eukprot:4925308-Pyramimonas_sp.AAC.1